MVNQCCVALASFLQPLSSITSYIFLREEAGNCPPACSDKKSIAVLSHLDNTTSASVPQNSETEPVAGPSGEQLTLQPVRKVSQVENSTVLQASGTS